MTLSGQFKEDNIENIRIYHYVEELIFSCREHMSMIDFGEITLSEYPFLIRLRFNENTTQQELAEGFRKTEGYTAKVLRKFEDLGLITRQENPENRRKKIVKLTQKGLEKTDEILGVLDSWEEEVTSVMTKEEVYNLKEGLFKIALHTDDMRNKL
ncbi:MarR family winged helix-turn-helix transcriptional regulator [Methanosphaera sp.]